jgi:pimeloyl-ACP methyl ester carboxylesterase
MPSAFSIAIGSGVGLALAAAAGASLAGRSLERRWRSQHDPIGPGGMSLPRGERMVVTTDDGAELAAMVCEPAGPTRSTVPTGSSGSAGSAGAIEPAAATTATDPPTVVLVHGWTCTRRVWGPVARRLVETGHRVVMYDLRGHGESTFGDSPAPVAVSRFGEDVAAVLEQLDVRDAVLAGHSMGGFSVMAFACDHPEILRDRVRGLALVATAAHGLGAGSRTPFVTRVLGSKVPTWALGRPRMGLVLLRNVVGRQPCYAHVAATRDMFVATPPHVTAACFACFAPMDLRTDLAKVDVPSAVLVGSQDMLTPVALSRAIVAAVPSARFDLLPDAGHMLPLETPDEVAAAITQLAV